MVSSSEMNLNQFRNDMLCFMDNIKELSGRPKLDKFVEMFEYLKVNQTFFNSHPKLHNFRTIFSNKIKEFEEDLPQTQASEEQLQVLQTYIELFSQW